MPSGGDAPRAERPWRLVLVVYGFSSKRRALSFETAWQKPHTSRCGMHKGTGGVREAQVVVRLAALAMLLEHAAWGESELSVRVCLPEECGRALRPVRAAAVRLTCGPWAR